MGCGRLTVDGVDDWRIALPVGAASRLRTLVLTCGSGGGPWPEPAAADRTQWAPPFRRWRGSFGLLIIGKAHDGGTSGDRSP